MQTSLHRFQIVNTAVMTNLLLETRTDLFRMRFEEPTAIKSIAS